MMTPKSSAPKTSPNPKEIMPKRAFESAVLSSTSGPCCNTMMGVRIPDQKAMDNPVQIN